MPREYHRHSGTEQLKRMAIPFLVIPLLSMATISDMPRSGITPAVAVSQQLRVGPARWQAKWVWKASTPWMDLNAESQALEFKQLLASEKNLHLYFRKTFDLSEEVKSASAYVCADSRYRLYVNGRFVGRGPVRSYPQFQYFDVYDLGPYLRPGKNLVAAIAHFYGEATAWYVPSRAGVVGFGSAPRAVPGKGGFLFQCDILTSQARQITVATDETWNMKVAEPWKQDTARVNFSLGFVEVYDAQKEPVGWRNLDFDDSGWRHPLAYWSWTEAVPPTEPFTEMRARDIPFLMEKPVAANKIVEIGEVTDSPADVPADQMAREEIVPLSTAGCGNPENLLVADGKYAVVQAPVGKSVSVVLDFGRTVMGYPHLEVDAFAGAIIDIGVSERLRRNADKVPSRSTALADSPTPTGQTVQNKAGIHLNIEHGKQVDRYIARVGEQEWEAQEYRGFRYMQVTFRNIARPLKVDAVSINFTSYPIERRGRFECSDQRLNQIWETGAYTLQMCMADAYMDCPSREQRQWVGDAYVEAMVNYAAFGDARLTAKLVRQTAQSQQADGMTMAYAPGDHDVLQVTVADFCLHWISTIYQYYMYTGDANLVRELYPNVRLAIAWFERHLNSDGLLYRVPHWTFIDWADIDKRGAVTALNALFYKALADAALMAELSGAPSDARGYEKLAQGVKKGINDRMWDPIRQVYVDCYADGKPSRRVSQQSNAVAILFAIAPEERWPAIIKYVTDPERVKLRQTDMSGLITSGPFDQETDVTRAQPFFSFYLHRALARARASDKAVARIKQLWGKMLDAGATTWWEEWEPRGASSQCHAWSSAPTYDLSTDVLGIHPTDPGFARFAVEPQPAGLEYASGVFPTIKGDIEVAWKASPKHFSLRVRSPEITRMELRLPVNRSSQVQVNEALVWSGEKFVRNPAGIVDVRWIQGSLTLMVQRGGDYRVETDSR